MIGAEDAFDVFTRNLDINDVRKQSLEIRSRSPTTSSGYGESERMPLNQRVGGGGGVLT